MSKEFPNDHDLSVSIIERVSKLARITITDEEHDPHIKSMDSILGMLHQLDDLDLSKVDIKESKALTIEQARPDQATDVNITGYMSKELQSFDQESSLFIVPEFIDQE